MQIEKINDNQIRCTLTREDLAQRQMKLAELTYGSPKARALFKEMMNQAYEEVGFESTNIPLMIEAVPVSADCLVLIITRVENPEEFDTRFSRFSKGNVPGEEDLSFGDQIGSAHTSPGFSNVLEEDPEVLHYDEDTVSGSQEQMSVSGDADVYRFSSTQRDGDLETTLEISIEKDDQDSVPVDLFNMSAQEMLSYLAGRAREIREELNRDQKQTDSPDQAADVPALPVGEDQSDLLPAAVDKSPSLPAENTAPAKDGQKDSGRTTGRPSPGRPGPEAAAVKKDFRCYYFSNFQDISRLCSLLEPFYRGMSSLFRDPTEGSYYLLLRRGDSERDLFKRACTLAADFGRSLDLSYGTDSYFKEHFHQILAEDAVALAATLL